jgi:hypothetical protein
LTLGNAPKSSTFSFSPFPALDIFGFHAFQPRGLR